MGTEGIDKRIKRELEAYIYQSSKNGYDIKAPNYVIESLIHILLGENDEKWNEILSDMTAEVGHIVADQ